MIVLERHEKKKINCAVFDFDGTISTLRCGWESVMEPLMLEYIFGEDYTEENVKEVRDYIAASTGIQTILQMKWLAEQVKAILAQYPADHPAVQELKNSPLYQQVAYLIEE